MLLFKGMFRNIIKILGFQKIPDILQSFQNTRANTYITKISKDKAIHIASTPAYSSKPRPMSLEA